MTLVLVLRLLDEEASWQSICLALRTTVGKSVTTWWPLSGDTSSGLDRNARFPLPIGTLSLVGEDETAQ